MNPTQKRYRSIKERPRPTDLPDPYDYLEELRRGDSADHLRAEVLERLLILEEEGVSARIIGERQRANFGSVADPSRISRFKRPPSGRRPESGRPPWGTPPTLLLQEAAAAGMGSGETPDDLEFAAMRAWLKAGGRAIRDLL